MTATNIFKIPLKAFKKYHWRMFEGKYVIFLWVCAKDEIALFIDLVGEHSNGFYLMESPTLDELYIVCEGDKDFELCKKIICEEPNWQKNVLLLRRSPRKVIQALCNTTLMESKVFKEIGHNHPKKVDWLAKIISEALKK